MADHYLDLLQDLVNIDSGTGDEEGIAKIGGILERELRALRFNFEKLTAGDGTNHFYASRGQGERILLIAHLDTVFAKGTVSKRSFRIAGDRAYGPGVSDCKSGIVTIIGALTELSRGNWPDYEIGCFFNSDEEIGSPGSRAIIERLAKGSKAVLVVEPAEGESITISRKGIGRFELKVFGKAAHSGANYQNGSNAILELAHKVIAIQTLSGMLPGVTFNVGVIQGGIRPNIIPDYAAAEIDLRLQEPGQEEPAKLALQNIANQVTVRGCSAKLSGGITRPPMPLTEQNWKLYELFKQVGGDLGIEIGTFESGGGSDANFTAALGVPTIDGVGPAGGGHHAEDEYLVLSSLESRIGLLGRFLRAVNGFS